MLEDLAREPMDFPVCAAKIALASIRWTQAAVDEAQRLMGEALADCETANRTRATGQTDHAVFADVLAIRNVVFTPTGSETYGAGRWNGFSWPATNPPFVIVNPILSVRFSSGAVTRVPVYEPFAAVQHTLFLDAARISLLSDLMVKLGGTRTREPVAIMETPNQPVGRSVEILAFWKMFFPARQGHWGGWVFDTYPIIGEIRFLDAERTKAAVPVTIGYAGVTVVLEKVEGMWKATGLVNRWAT